MAVGSAFAARTSQPERVFGLAFAGVTAYAYGFLVNAAALIEAFGPAGIFYVKIALGVCAAAVAAVSVSSPRPSSGGVAQDEGVASGLRASFSDRFRILACGFLLYVGHAAVWTYEERMGVNIGMTGAQVGQALGLASIASFVASLLAAALGTKFGRTWPQFLALGASVAAAAFIVESGSSFAFTTSACLIGIAWFYGVPYLAGVAAAADSTGKTASLLAAVMTTGYAVGPFAAASIIGATFKPVGWFAAVLYIACAVLVIPSSRRVAAIRRVPTY
jgi:predicted MFS family arabinose efflux permease